MIEKTLEERKKILERKLGRPLCRARTKELNWENARFTDSGDELLDSKKPLLPQLNIKWRKCFSPWASNLQLIRFVCDGCLQNEKCLFYDVIQSHIFSSKRTEILADTSIQPIPKEFKNPETIRLCIGNNSLEEILKNNWKLILHRRNIPDNSLEFKKWKTKEKKLKLKSFCGENCEKLKYCNFYLNSLEKGLCYSEVLGYDQDKEEFIYSKNSGEIDKGFLTSSYLYKKFITPSIVKELPEIKTEAEFKKLEDKNYEIYEKVYNKIKNKPKEKIIIPKAILDTLTKEKNEGVFEKILAVKNSLGGLDYKKVRGFLQKHNEELSDSTNKFVELDFTFWKEWCKVQKLNPEDILYFWFLSLEKNPYRDELADRFGIDKKQQIEMERRGLVRKIFKGILNHIQYSNEYFVNGFCLGGVFRFLTINETTEYLKGTVENNKRIVKHKKLLNKNGQPKITIQQFKDLEKLHQNFQHVI